MLRIALGVAVLVVAAGCEPAGPKRVEADKVVADAPNPGATWPLMLQHCLRSPSCDPTSDFGQGSGQASGVSGTAAWFAEAQDVVKEGGRDYGAAITVSLYAASGQGGKAGRPLTIDEAPDSLHGTDARRSTLSIEYRTPGGGKPEAYFLALHSAQLALAGPVDEAKIEIRGKAGVLFSGDAAGMPANEATGDRRTVTPFAFYTSRNLRDEPLPKLIKALMGGETLSLKIAAPGGELMLSDVIYAAGYDGAVKAGTDALADPEIARTVAKRCERFAGKPDEFWKVADVTPALLVCDTRTLAQKWRDEGAPAAKGRAQ